MIRCRRGPKIPFGFPPDSSWIPPGFPPDSPHLSADFDVIAVQTNYGDSAEQVNISAVKAPLPFPRLSRVIPGIGRGIARLPGAIVAQQNAEGVPAGPLKVTQVNNALGTLVPGSSRPPP